MSRILVIDDSELVNNLLKEELTQAGYEVAQAMDANQGYAAALEFRPDLVLLDVQLPDLQGFDLIRVFKNNAQLRQVPIIMITGTHHQTDHKVKAFQAGADDYVLKPFEMPELIERVRALLRRSQQPLRTVTPSPMAASKLAAAPAQKELPRLSLGQAFTTVLGAPWTLPVRALWPPVSFFFLTAALGLSLGAVALSAGAGAKAAIVGIVVLGLWIAALVVLVVSCSLMGLPLQWREGATLISLAASPILLKLAGAFVTTAWTTLSPFYFTASPALFWEQAPIWVCRLDIFELWAIVLVGQMVRRRPGGSPQKARIVMLCLWSTALIFAMAIGKLGAGQ